jgi:hypothetical protein
MADTTRVQIDTPDGPVVVSWRASSIPEIEGATPEALRLLGIGASDGGLWPVVDTPPEGDPETDAALAAEAAFLAGWALALAAREAGAA